MNMHLIFFIFGVMLVTQDLLWAQDKCQKWFDNAKIGKSKDCMLECAMIPVTLGNFTCQSRCPEFCKSTKREQILFELSDLYPGLTSKERALASKEPLKMLRVYELTWKTESMCLELYPASKTNDESDACRHFIWAALLMQKFGKAFAEEVLDAHEFEPSQPEEEKIMDQKNNRQGISMAEVLMKNNQFSDKNIVQAFKKELTQNHLTILRSQTKQRKQ